MANYKDNNSQQGAFISVIPSEQILPGSFDHTVCLLIDHVLNLSAFDHDYKNDQGGRAAYSPAVLLKIILAAYHRGITGSRKIEQLCKTNTVFMALSGFLTPDHSTLAAFVSKSPSRIEVLFTEVVMACDDLGLIGKDAFAIDGTKLSSNASKEQSGRKADFTRRYQKVRKAIRYMLKQHREEDSRGERDNELRAKEEKQIDKLRTLSRRLKHNIDTMNDKIGSKGQAKKSNMTDPDSATMMSGAGGAKQGYMALACVDKKHQVIGTADITGDTEQGAFIDLLDQLGQNLDNTRNQSRVLADAGFLSTDNVNHCYENGIDAYIADNKYRKRDPRFTDHETKKPESRKQKYFRAEDFHHDESSNHLTCPAGKVMWLSIPDYELNGERYQRFTGYLNDCRNCSLQSRCMRASPKECGRQVSIKKGREVNPPRPLDLMKEKIDTRKGRAIYSDRMGIVEPVFAHIKFTLGLDWLSLRGKAKVKGQWLLFCMVHNLVKIQRYGDLKPV